MNAQTDPRSCWAPYRGAVSLTFDDGTPNQLEKAVPVLDEFGLKGTFYIPPRGDNWRSRLAPWREVAAAGHEIGNHSLTHPCPNNLFGRPDGVDDMSLEDIESDIVAAQARLVELAPEQEAWTFAYPCYATHVGRGAGRQSYAPVVARHFVAGRAGGEYGFGNNPLWVDLAAVAGQSVERMSGFEMIGLAEELAARGHWAILVFHEIDGQRLTVGTYDYRMLLAHLRRRSDQIWTAPVVEVARRVAAFQRQLSSGEAS
jgi:hypothetical protein